MRLHFSSSSYWICYLFSFKSIYITKSTNLYKLIFYIPTSYFSSTGKLLVLLRGLMLSRSIKQKVNMVIPTPIQDCFFSSNTCTCVSVWVSVKISDGFNPKLIHLVHCLSAYVCMCVISFTARWLWWLLCCMCVSDCFVFGAFRCFASNL